MFNNTIQMIQKNGLLVSFTLILFFSMASTAFAQEYAVLRIRVRTTDGNPAVGTKVAIYYDEMGELPDVFEGDCIVPRSGYCEFALEAGGVPYTVKFPDGQKPDPITAAAAGHQGIDGVGIILRSDTTIGFVLSTLAEGEQEANWMLLDLQPEDDTPAGRVPSGAVQEAEKILENIFPTVTPRPTDAVIAVPTVGIPPTQETGTEISPEYELIGVEDVESDAQTEVSPSDEAQQPEGSGLTQMQIFLYFILPACLILFGIVVILVRQQQTKARGDK